MSKLINKPIRVHTVGPPVVSAFIWRKQFYRVLEVIAQWREPGKWWDNEPAKSYIRDRSQNISIGTYELVNNGSRWFQHRVLD